MKQDLWNERVWRKRGVQATLKILGHVETLLTEIKDETGQGIERALAEVRKARERVEAKVAPREDAAA